MKKAIISSIVILGMLLTCSGIGLVGIQKVRDAAALMSCKNNLKQFGLALHGHHYNKEHFPTGSIANEDLLVEKKLGWIPQITSYMAGAPFLRIDTSKSWDDEANSPPVWDYRGPLERSQEAPYYCKCPATGPQSEDNVFSSTHYLGITGVGNDSATLPVDHPRAGFFGYDRKLTKDDLKDGASTTFTLLESLDGGPWTSATGTLRAINPDGPEYLGMTGQFQTGHEGSQAINAAFADGSVHTLRAPVSREVWDALATVAGNESVALPEWD